MLISSNRPQRFLPPSRAQSDVQTRLHLCNRDQFNKTFYLLHKKILDLNSLFLLQAKARVEKFDVIK